MTTLQDLRKAALSVSKKKKQQEKTAKESTTKTETSNTTPKSTTQISKQQQDAISQMAKNIQNQWIIRWNITNAKQTAENKTQQKFLSWMSNKQSNDYNYLINNWYSEKDAKNVVNKVTPKTVSNWTAEQQNDYDYLVSNWYSEKQAKNIIQDIRYNQIYNEQLQSNLDSGMREWKAERKANKAAQKDIQTDWSTWKKIWTWVKWFGEWLADIWQNTLWRWVDRVAGKIITWITWEEYTPQWDTSILSEEQQKSRIWNVSQKAWTTAWLTTLWVLGWWVAAWWAWAIWAAAGSPLVWWLAGVGLWWLEWVAGTELWTLTTDKRLATWKELAIWWAIWWVAGGIWGYANAAKRLTPEYQAKYLANQAKSQQEAIENNVKQKVEKYSVNETSKLSKWERKIANMIQDTSKSGKQQAIKWWRTSLKKGILSKWQVQELSQSEKNAAKIINKEWLLSKDPQKTYNNINKAINRVAWEMSDDMKKIKIDNTVKWEIKDYVKAVWEASDMNKVPWWKRKLSVITNNIDKADNADDLWNIRKAFDDLFTDNQKINANWNYDAIQNLWREWRWVLTNAMNKAADDAWEEWVKAWMKYLSSMINAKENLWANILKEIWKSTPTRLWSLAKKWAIWWAAVRWYNKLKNVIKQ